MEFVTLCAVSQIACSCHVGVTGPWLYGAIQVEHSTMAMQLTVVDWAEQQAEQRETQQTVAGMCVVLR